MVRVRNTGSDLEMVEQFWAIRLMKAKVFGASMEGSQPTLCQKFGLATELAYHYHIHLLNPYRHWEKDGG